MIREAFIFVYLSAIIKGFYCNYFFFYLLYAKIVCNLGIAHKLHMCRTLVVECFAAKPIYPTPYKH